MVQWAESAEDDSPNKRCKTFLDTLQLWMSTPEKSVQEHTLSRMLSVHDVSSFAKALQTLSVSHTEFIPIAIRLFRLLATELEQQCAFPAVAGLLCHVLDGPW